MAAPETVNIHQAKTHLSRLVERAAAGNEIVIAKAGKPMARLVPYDEPKAPRELGFLRGQVRIHPGFDAMDEEIQRLFEEG